MGFGNGGMYADLILTTEVERVLIDPWFKEKQSRKSSNESKSIATHSEQQRHLFLRITFELPKYFQYK